VNITLGEQPTKCSLDQLSTRERDVLEHLARHKTSKVIARELGVHENTINKHLAAVRGKWGTADRYETAQVFLDLLEGGGIHPPQIPSSDDYLITAPEAFADLPHGHAFRLSDVLTAEPFRFPDTSAPAGLEALDARFGKAWRVLAIPVAAILIGMVLVVGVTIVWVLTELL
jgi:DNA-binding CsgD family transcriptional regulator